MSDPEVTKELLTWLDSLDSAGEAAPWTAMLEGRDHMAGEDFIMVGRDGDRREDVYVLRDSGPALGIDLELIAAARNYLPVLVREVRRLRGWEPESNG